MRRWIAHMKLWQLVLLSVFICTPLNTLFGRLLAAQGIDGWEWLLDYVGVLFPVSVLISFGLVYFVKRMEKHG